MPLIYHKTYRAKTPTYMIYGEDEVNGGDGDLGTVRAHTKREAMKIARKKAGKGFRIDDAERMNPNEPVWGPI